MLLRFRNSFGHFRECSFYPENNSFTDVRGAARSAVGRSAFLCNYGGAVVLFRPADRALDSRRLDVYLLGGFWRSAAQA